MNGTAKMIHDALAAGIQAAHVLMDTWFTNEPFIKKVLDEGIGVIFEYFAPRELLIFI